MKLYGKIIIALISGIIALIMLFGFIHFSYTYFLQRLIITDKIDAIASVEKELDALVLKNDKILYLNQDIFPQKIEKLHTLINTLHNDPHLIATHPSTLHAVEVYEDSLEKKIQLLYDLQTTSSTIKNSTIAIPALLQKSLLLFDPAISGEAHFLSAATSATLVALLAKSTMDGEFLNTIEQQTSQIQKLSFLDTTKQELAHALIQNFYVFRNDFPVYLEIINALQNGSTTQNLNELRHVFSIENTREIRRIIYFGIVLILFYIISIGIIIYFLIRSEKTQRIDRLTGLYNRKALNDFIHSTPSPILLLININVSPK